MINGELNREFNKLKFRVPHSIPESVVTGETGSKKLQTLSHNLQEAVGEWQVFTPTTFQKHVGAYLLSVTAFPPPPPKGRRLLITIFMIMLLAESARASVGRS